MAPERNASDRPRALPWVGREALVLHLGTGQDAAKSTPDCTCPDPNS